MKTSKKLLVFSYNILGDNMNRKLPRVFANTLINKINNNERVYYSNKKEIAVEPKDNESIQNKINKIFRSIKYVYKVNVEIKTLDGVSEYKIIGKNKNNLITIDNNLIPISNIIDIKEV